jgi:hypothetical protein
VFSDAMHVTAAIALEAAGRPYTPPNIARMFERIYPSEVLTILRLRLARPDEYADLPKAHATDALSACALDTAAALAENLTQEELDAFFVSGVAGNA